MANYFSDHPEIGFYLNHPLMKRIVDLKEKGYEDKDLHAYADGTKDLHYLNVQGDRSNAMLMVVNPVMEVRLSPRWAATVSGAYYLRRTFYKYYDNVKANTFETKIGLTCKL